MRLLNNGKAFVCAKTPAAGKLSHAGQHYHLHVHIGGMAPLSLSYDSEELANADWQAVIKELRCHGELGVLS
jgi:hypothetical protein